MKGHYHTGFDTALIIAIETALIFHGFRFLAARLATASGPAGKVGQAVGGAFTFGGLH